MRRSVAAAVVALASAAGPLAAQSRQQPNLILTINGGLTTGGELWTLAEQLVPVAGATDADGQFDTLRLGRRLRPGVVGSLVATLYRSRHLGYAVEIGFFGVDSEGRCAPVVPYHPDQASENKNRQACEGANGLHFGTNVIGFQGGLVYRMAPAGPISPYLRATGGIGALGSSYVQTFVRVRAPVGCAGSGSSECNIALLIDEQRRGATWAATLAAGFTAGLGQGYQVRLEARDFVVSLPYASESVTPTTSNPDPVALVGMRARHVLVLTVGLDVILERRHRRRY